MAKLKKHQLLEKAMRDYPAGTRFTSYSEKFEFSYTSTGLFVSWKENYNKEAHKDSIWRVNELGEPSGIVYNGLNKEWAKIVKPPILSGKVAIQVNNEREFNIVQDYRTKIGCNVSKREHGMDFPIYTALDKRYKHTAVGYEKIYLKEYSLLNFSDFAVEIGIEVPEFVMTSEDGVDLYKYDAAHHVCFYNGSYRYNGWFTVSGALDPLYSGKAFSTKEAAEKWIAEQNKPANAKVKLRNGGTANVYKDHICLHGGIKLAPSDLEDMLHAYKIIQ